MPWIRATAIGGGVGIVMDLPGFLTGALAVDITGDLAFGTVGLGVAVAAVRAAAAATSPSVGVLADRLGAIQALRLAAGAAIVSATGIALAAGSLLMLTLWLAVAGCGIACCHAGANRLLSKAVPLHRQGVAFGIKQSAPPTATLLAGLSVPAIAAVADWRWAYGCAALAAAAMMLAIGRRPGPKRTSRARSRRRARLGHSKAVLLLNGAFFCGTASAVATPVFYVDAAVQAGSRPAFAGALLAVASAATILTRLTCGFVSDRIRSGHLTLCAGLLVAGAIGFMLLTSDSDAVMASGAILAMATTWGFNGVFWFAVVRAFSTAPGTITGLLGPGGHLGGTLGPILIGLLAELYGYPTAWATCGAVSFLAALLMVTGGRFLPTPDGE